jgi:steroid 5-alpha reductase family enzyme
MGELFANTGLLVASCMTLLWLLSLVLRDASIVDIWWGLGFSVVAVATFAWTRDGDDGRRALLTAMTVLWGLRLALYLFSRNAGHGEDPRYQAMRRHWGARFAWVSLFTVFLFQGIILWIVSLPVQVGQLAPGSALGVLDAVGVVLFGTGLFFEAVGDAQLARFRRDPANASAVMDRGLWRYTRHPNYFGDCCVWWGIYLVAASSGSGAWTVVGPLLMTFLLLRVSGVALLERSIRKRRPDYERYVQRTSAFFPWPPKPAPDAGDP